MPNDNHNRDSDQQVDMTDVVEEHFRESFDEDTSTRKKVRLFRTMKRLHPRSIREQLKKHAFPIFTAVLLLTIFITFRKILLPFVFATVLVYLMEPIVRRLSTPGASKYVKFSLPRWLSVIIVYLVFLGVISLSGFLIIPQLVNEGIRVVQSVPATFQKIRQEQLPELDDRIQSYIQEYLPDHSQDNSYSAARTAIDNARKIAFVASIPVPKPVPTVAVAAQPPALPPDSPVSDWVSRAIGTANSAAKEAAEKGKHLENKENHAKDKHPNVELVPPEPVKLTPKSMKKMLSSVTPEMLLSMNGTTGWTYSSHNHNGGIKLIRNKDDQYELSTNNFELNIDEVSPGHWVIRNERNREVDVVDNTPQVVSLQSMLDGTIDDISQFSNERFTSLINFLRTIVVGVIGGFVAIILTMMVAAFMSIDLPRVLAYIRTLVPPEGRKGYDVLLKRIDHGVSGVVRGQLLICFINGVLTYIGLHLLDIDFALLLAVIAGTLSLVPVFGTVISTVPIVLFSLSDGIVKALLSLCWILFIHFVEANILNPKIIGKSAEIHPVIVIFALLAGESAFGIIGALLAVPVASILLTFYEFLRTEAWRTQDDPAPAHDDRIVEYCEVDETLEELE